MPTPKKGARLGGSPSHQRKILSNLAAQLFENGSIRTTDAKAKALRPYAEKLITKAKGGTLADRRNVLKLVPQKDVVKHLFDELAPQFAGRDGGYTRIVKLENRKGDNAPMSQISLVLEPVTPKTRTAKVEAPVEEPKAEAPAAEEAEGAEAEAEATEAAEAETEAAAEEK